MRQARIAVLCGRFGLAALACVNPYQPIIEARLAAYPERWAVRLLEEIRGAEYDGSYTQLKAFVRRVRPTAPPEPVIRFETPAGRQAQVDFARFRFPWGVRYALLVVLRLLAAALAPVLSVDQRRQMKAVITRDLRLEDGALIRNAEFLRFAHHWGFTRRACRPCRAQTKGEDSYCTRWLRERAMRDSA